MPPETLDPHRNPDMTTVLNTRVPPLLHALSRAALATALLGPSLPAVAAPPATASPWYLAGDVGIANFSGSGADDDDSTFSVALGYQWAPQVALELAYRDLGQPGGVSAWALQGSAVGTLALQGPLGAYGRLGLARVDADQGYWRLAFGFGAQYDWKPQLRVRAGYERYGKVEGVSTGLWTVGAAYRF